MNTSRVTRQVPQFLCNMWCHRSQQLHHRLQRVTESRAACHRLTLLLDQRVVAFHQSGQGSIETEAAQLLSDALDGFVAQSLNAHAFTSFLAARALNPCIVDQAPEAVQEAPHAL